MSFFYNFVNNVNKWLIQNEFSLKSEGIFVQAIGYKPQFKGTG